MTESNVAICPDKPAYETTRLREMEAFDSLPPRLREFLRNLPENFASEEVHCMLYMGISVDEIIESGRVMIAERYGSDWKPI